MKRWQIVTAAVVGLYLYVVAVPPPYSPMPWRYQSNDTFILDTWTGRAYDPALLIDLHPDRRK